MISTQTADARLAQKRANAKREEDIARFHDNKAPASNLRDDWPTVEKIVNLYVDAARNKSTRSIVRDFLTVVAEGAMILGDVDGRAKARALKVSVLTTDHMLRWRNQECRIKAELEPRTASNVNYFMRAAKSVFSDQDITETYNRLTLPLTIQSWRKVSQLKAQKTGGFQQIPQDILGRMDRRAKRFFLRVAQWFERHGKPRLANQFRNAHACYWLMRRAGLRNSEVEGLTWQTLRRDERGKMWIHLHGPYWQPKGSPGQVPMAQDLYDELVSIFGPVRPGLKDYVLLGTKSDRWAGTHRTPSKFCRRYLSGDRDKSIYQLRAQYGSEMVLKYGIETASKLLRHADITTTWKHYTALIKLQEVQPL
jgi:integrase